MIESDGIRVELPSWTCRASTFARSFWAGTEPPSQSLACVVSPAALVSRFGIRFQAHAVQRVCTLVPHWLLRKFFVFRMGVGVVPSVPGQ